MKLTQNQKIKALIFNPQIEPAQHVDRKYKIGNFFLSKQHKKHFAQHIYDSCVFKDFVLTRLT